MMRWVARSTLIAGLCAAGTACQPGTDRTEGPVDVLIVTVDTARADRFSFAGPSPVTTAATDALAAEGAAFLTAIAPSPITLVSHSSLFTGQEPFVHGVRNNGDFALAPEAVTLAELLADDGWATAAFIGASVLDSRYGLDQGFGHYDDEIAATDATGMFTYPRRRGGEVVAAALQWLGGVGQDSTFVWVHLFDPHAPYDPPEPEKSDFPESGYDGAIAYADRVVGELLDGYRRLGRYDRGLVVLTSDHGESLGEHGERTHGVFVYDATVRVPLVIRGPGIEPGVRLVEPVSLIDVMPTVLGLAGIAIPPTVAGHDLMPLLRGEVSDNDDGRVIYVESLLPKLSYGWSPLQGLRTARWKFIRGVAPELYNLEADPVELHDLAGIQTDVTVELSSQLVATLGREHSTTADRLEVDEAERSRLAALGYVSYIDDVESVSDPRGLPDPRERIHVMNRMYAAMSRFAEGDPGGAVTDLEALVAEEPNNVSAWASLAELHFRLGDYAGAADAYGRAARLARGSALFIEREGLALERQGRLNEALAACDRGLALDPERVSSRDFRWRLLARLGREEELVPELEAELLGNPANGMARVLLAQTRHGHEPSAALIQALEEALAELPGDISLTAALAGAVYAMGDEDRAVRLYRRVLEEHSGNLRASLVVGRKLLEMGEIEEARRIIEAGVRRNPDRAAMQILDARLRMATEDFQSAREALVRAYQLAPGLAETWLMAGELGILEGLSGEAAANLDRAAAAAGDDPELWRRLAAANRRLGRESEAAAADTRAARRP